MATVTTDRPTAATDGVAVEGIDVTLSDGQEWRLAPPGLAPMLDGVRDEMFDQSVYDQTARMAHVLQVAWVCLLANYRLSDGELAALLTGMTEDQERGLVRAVMDLMFGPGGTYPLRTYTDWALTSLYANGLDPKAIPPARIPDVLEMLVKTGRALPQDKWISCVMHAEKRAGMLELFDQAAQLKRLAPGAGG